MGFEFGIFNEFQRRSGVSEAQAFAESFEQVDMAEELGLDAVWLAELHCMPERSVLASPMTVATAIAARTSRVKVGLAVQVLPLCHPLRLAEETATLDHISGGRFIAGVGRSGFPSMYQAYGIDYGESRERFAEVLEVLRRAWTEKKFSFAGKYYNFDDVHLVPKPLQQPHPPIRIAATGADTYASIGKQGFPIFVAVRLGSLEELAPNIEVYREAYAAAGHPGTGEVYMRAPIYVAETAERARAEPEESLMAFYHALGAQIEATQAQRGVNDAADRAQRADALQGLTYDDALRDKLIVGTPEMVTRRIDDIRRKLGLNGILAEMNCGGMIPQDRVMNSLSLMCREVAPHFR